jgi:hypothetical protein
MVHSVLSLNGKVDLKNKKVKPSHPLASSRTTCGVSPQSKAVFHAAW